MAEFTDRNISRHKCAPILFVIVSGQVGEPLITSSIVQICLRFEANGLNSSLFAKKYATVYSKILMTDGKCGSYDNIKTRTDYL